MRLFFNADDNRERKGVEICIKISKKIVAVIDKMEEIFST